VILKAVVGTRDERRLARTVVPSREGQVLVSARR
jgi:hypothetical protein